MPECTAAMPVILSIPATSKSTVKHPDSLMVWGCFSDLGLGKLVVLPKNLKVNANVYLELLADHLPESFDMCSAKILKQDFAPAQTAKSATQWLRDCKVPFY